MGIMAGIGGLVGGLGGLFGSNMPSAPPQFQMPNMGSAANSAFGGISGLTPFANTGAGALSPAQSTFQNLYSNPFAGGFQSGANFAGGLGQTAALGGFNTGGQLQQAGLNTIPMANQVFNTAFDPQNALYARTLQQVQDQSRANAEAAGVGATPYGAGLANQATQNFNIDWQNQQLQRQALGAQSAGGLLQTGAGVANMGTGIQNAAPGQFLQASGMPYGAFGQIGGDQNQAIQSLLSNASSGANLANLPVQDWLSYLGVGNQANQVANQNYLAQLQAQNQQFNQQMMLGGLLGRSLYGLGQSPLGGFGIQGGFGGLFGGPGPLSGLGFG